MQVHLVISCLFFQQCQHNCHPTRGTLISYQCHHRDALFETDDVTVMRRYQNLFHCSFKSDPFSIQKLPVYFFLAKVTPVRQ